MASTDLPRRSSRWLCDNYHEITILGKGAQGAVTLSRNKKSKQLAAVKMVPRNIGHASRMTEREARFLSALRTSNIVHLEEWYTTSTDYVLILEACDYDLYQCMDMYRQVGLVLPHLFVWRVFSRIADALAYCHHSGIVHHDVKPPNVLVKWAGRDVDRQYPDIVLADFGAATQNTESNYSDLTAPAYTMLYHPPDKLRGPTMDVWGLGSIIHEIALGRTVVKPMPAEVKQNQLARQIWVRSVENKSIGRGVGRLYSEELQYLMYQCLRFTPSNRIEAKPLSYELHTQWRKKLDTVEFEPLKPWCRETVEARAVRFTAAKEAGGGECR